MARGSRVYDGGRQATEEAKQRGVSVSARMIFDYDYDDASHLQQISEGVIDMAEWVSGGADESILIVAALALRHHAGKISARRKRGKASSG